MPVPIAPPLRVRRARKAPDPHVPRVVATIGLHGSASTWVFNVVREVMIAGLGADRVVALFSDDAAGIVAPPAVHGRHVVVKAHQNGAGLQSFLWLARAPIVLSIRDPRDALLSLAQRFEVPFDAAARAMAIDCRFVQACADAGHPVHRFEDGFFLDRAVPARIAHRLGLKVKKATCDAIFDRYHTDAVRAFTGTIGDLPPERRDVSPGTIRDRLTEYHATHIGDGQVGKWRTLLSAAQQRKMTRLFASFLKRFGYPA